MAAVKLSSQSSNNIFTMTFAWKASHGHVISIKGVTYSLIDVSKEKDKNKHVYNGLKDFRTVCISNTQYLGLGGPWVCAVSALV